MADGSRSFTPSDKGELDRIAAMYREHAGMVCRVLRRCGVFEADLDDATQETFLVAYRRLADFEGRSTERTWLYAIAVRVASTIRRGHRREVARREKVGDEMHGALIADPESELSKAEARDLLDTLLAELDDKKRTVFVLAELEEVKTAEIARILNLNPGTVSSRLRLARESFSAALRRHNAREEGRMQRAGVAARALAGHAPDRRPRRAAAAALIANIKKGTAPTHPGWQQIALGPAPALTFLAPLGVTLALGGSGLAVAAAVASPGSDTEPAAKQIAAQPEDAAPDKPRMAQPEPVAPVPVATPSTVTAPADPATSDTPTRPSSPPRQPTRTPRARPSAKPAPSPTTNDAVAQFDAELALIERARLALRGKQTATARAALDEHAEKFANGQFAKERRHTRIKILCLDGKTAEAKAMATRLAGGRPDAPAMRVFDRACAPPAD